MNLINLLENCEKYNQLPESTKQLIRSICTSKPVKPISNRFNNVQGRFASRKMGITIPYGSHTLEGKAALLMEYDSKVILFLDQPYKLKIRYQNIDGRWVTHYYTVDYFIVSDDFIGFEELKFEKELEELSKKKPNRYVKIEGVWKDMPATEAAQALGLEFRVRTEKDLSPKRYDNLLFLEDYLNNTQLDLPSREVKHIKRILTDKPSVNLHDTLSNQSDFSADTLYHMIARNQIYVDLDSIRLARPETVDIFSSREMAEIQKNIVTATNPHVPAANIQAHDLNINQSILWDGEFWKVLNIGDKQMTLTDKKDNISTLSQSQFKALIDKGSITFSKPHQPVPHKRSLVSDIYNQAHPSDLEEAQKRFKLIQKALTTPGDYSTKIKRLVKKYQTAERTYGTGFIGLIPQHKRKGNRTRKLDTIVYDIMLDEIEEHYLNKRKINKSRVYQCIVARCKELMIDYPSQKTVNKYINLMSHLEATTKRAGSKAAYNLTPHTRTQKPELCHSKPSYPWSEAHIDHTQLDVQLKSSRNNVCLGKPWLTLMIDTFSRRILAIHIGFDTPSYRSLMRVVRECVKRYHRLPQTIVTDNGKEFIGFYFETLLARFGIHKKNRPPSQPRYGAVNERVFGTTNTEFLHLLQGNNQPLQDPRSMSSEVDPRKTSAWTLRTFNDAITEWCYEVYDNMLHSMGSTPKQAYDFGMEMFGIREFQYIAYDRDFIIHSLPTTRKGTVKVKEGRGILINYLWFYNEQLNDPKLFNQQIPVKYDPEDISTAYVFINGHWIECRSEYAAEFAGIHEKDIQNASKEVRASLAYGKKRVTLNAARFMQFFQKSKSQEDTNLKQLRRAEETTSSEPKRPEMTVVASKSNTPAFDENELSILEDM